MALEGTLHDFALPDILQLISLQKKTGLLTLRGPEDTVILGFDSGSLVSAESQARRLDTRLGTLLVKTRSLAPDSLTKALEIQGQTLQRLGFILLKNGFCDADQLRAGLDAQVKKIAYGLFRWTDGEYVFDQQDRIDYDHEYFRPIQVESLLMEGARMVDEWPIIQKVVRSPELVYQRVAVGQRVEPAEGADDIEEIGEATFVKAREKRDGPIRISKAGVVGLRARRRAADDRQHRRPDVPFRLRGLQGFLRPPQPGAHRGGPPHRRRGRDRDLFDRDPLRFAHGCRSPRYSSVSSSRGCSWRDCGCSPGTPRTSSRFRRGAWRPWRGSRRPFPFPASGGCRRRSTPST